MTEISTRYRVRQQSSGYTSSVTYYVYDLVRKGRVTVQAARSRESAQAEADSLNIQDMILDYADDPRPYAVRMEEAKAAYRAGA